MSALLRFHRKIIFELKKNQELVNRIKVFKSKTTALCLFRPPLKDIFGVYSNPLVVFSTWQTIFSSFWENFVVSRVVMAMLRWREEPNRRKKMLYRFFRIAVNTALVGLPEMFSSTMCGVIVVIMFATTLSTCVYRVTVTETLT